MEAFVVNKCDESLAQLNCFHDARVARDN
jgi:hypothetical protein